MLKFGFAQEIITPRTGIGLSGYFLPRPNKGFHDHIYVKAALFEENGLVAGILSYDCCFTNRSVWDKFAEGLKKAGVDFADNLIFTNTHSHTGPYLSYDESEDGTDLEYMDEVLAKTIFAVKKAYASLLECEMYMGKTECSTLAFNRRFWMKDGSVLTNPGKLNPDIVKPESIIDPEIPFFVIRRDGMDVFMLAHITNHTDTVGDEYCSGDWCGRMERAIQDHYGYDIPVMTLVGCQGNINHFNVKNNVDQTCYKEACRIGRGYAAEIIANLYALEKVSDTALAYASREFEAPCVQISDAEYAAAKKITEDLKDVQAASADDLTSEGIAAGNLYVKKVFAQRIVDCREKPLAGKRMEYMRTLKFGKTLGIVTIPGEAFVEIGFGIKEKSPFDYTMVTGLAMGYFGYIGMPECYGRGGGYETRPGNTAPAHDLGPKIIDLGIEMLNN